MRESPVSDELADQKDERPHLASSAPPLKVLFLTDCMEAITAGGTERQLLQFAALAAQLRRSASSAIPRG